MSELGTSAITDGCKRAVGIMAYNLRLHAVQLGCSQAVFGTVKLWTGLAGISSAITVNALWQMADSPAPCMMLEWACSSSM